EAVRQAGSEEAFAAVPAMIGFQVLRPVVAKGFPKIAARGGLHRAPEIVLQEQINDWLVVEVRENDVIGAKIQSDVGEPGSDQAAEQVGAAPEVAGVAGAGDEILDRADRKEKKRGLVGGIGRLGPGNPRL